MSNAETDEKHWWKEAVFYEIYPRSFADGNGDGVGDLEGIRQRLTYLQKLGIQALWLCPIYPSPLADGGYDVSEYCDVAPDLGSLDDFDRLLDEAHAMGIRIVLDFVANHTSSEHPWFQRARVSSNPADREWYIWREAPNNWHAALGAGNAWQFDSVAGAYYLHFFLPSQPDLNWESPAVVSAMHSVMRFWLDRGVDGFRVDAAHCLGKDTSFADAEGLEDLPVAAVNDQPRTHELLRGMREVVDEYEGDRVLIGEIFLQNSEAVRSYLGDHGDELHLAFDFGLLRSSFEAASFSNVIANSEQVGESGSRAWPTVVLSNHDRARLVTRYGSADRARLGAVVQLTLRGTPFVFQGDELGLSDAEVPKDRRRDVHGRDGARAPLPWETLPPHGWGEPTWLPFPPKSETLSAEVQVGEADSIYQLYRALCELRSCTTVLRTGDFELVNAPSCVLGFRRFDRHDAVTVLANFASQPALVDVTGHHVVLGSRSARVPGEPFLGHLDGFEAVVLSRARGRTV